MVFGLARKVQIRKALVFAFCVAVFAGLTLSIAKIVKEGVNATEGNVRVTYDLQNPLYYADNLASEPDFSIWPEGAATPYKAFCGSAGELPPDGNGSYTPRVISTETENHKAIKLVLYAYKSNNDSLFETLFPGTDSSQRYGWVHSVVSLLFSGKDNFQLAEDDHAHEPATLAKIASFRTMVSNAKNTLIDIVRNDTQQLWTRAQDYILYAIGGSGNQTIFWIEGEPQPEYGAIKVTKKDADLSTKPDTPQGNASFDGITFVAEQDGVEKGRCALGGGGSMCIIWNLEFGEYTVREIKSSASYQVDVNTTKEVTVSHNSFIPEDVEFKDEVKKGNITVRKKDAKMQNGECKTTSGHSFNGITFGLYLDKTTSNRIKYGNKEYDPKSEQSEILIAKKTIGEDGCEVKFNNLPIAKYYIKEISANNDYIVSTEVKRVDLTADKSGTTIEVEFSNQPTSIGTVAVDGKDGDHYVEVSPESNIKDTIQYCVEPNKNYTIKGVLMDKSTGKELLVNGKKVEGSVDLKPTTSCGTVVMEFELDTSALGGKEVVVFERLYDHKDDGNYDDEEPIVEHEDIDDPKQTIDIISLETVAEDGTDGDKEILADQAAVVKDTVSYCVKPGQKYTIRGILMDKSTGEPLLVNGEKIEGAVEIEPTEACGTAEMLFHFDATGLQGKELVVFEKLYIFGEDNPDEDEPIITHEDINDENQAVIVYMPTPNTGRFTAKDGDGRIGEFILAPAAIVVVVGGYGIYRASARKRFLRRK